MSDCQKVIQDILKKHGIDNLQLEMDITRAIREMMPPMPRTAETTREEIVSAMKVAQTSYSTKEEITSAIRTRLSINPSSRDGEGFIDMAYLRAKHGESINTFIQWWLETFPDPKFWSFRRMREMWPQAFVKKESSRYVTGNDKWDKEFTPAPDEDE
jgi:hypothetical protein